MTLLEEIQAAAVDADSDLSTLLRKCKLLAARLGSKPLEDWLIWESNGYPPDAPVPEYRVFPLELTGHFSGWGGAQLRNAPISLACVPESARKHYERYECRQSIAGIESILAKGDRGGFQVSTGNLALVLGTKVYQGHNCIAAWAECAGSHLVELLNAVRNRILDFSLTLWKDNPNAGETSANGRTAVSSSDVTQVFNTTVYGGTAHLTGAGRDSMTFHIETGDLAGLKRLLRDSGVADADLHDLEQALASEPETLPDGFGPSVTAWISKMLGKAADGTWKVGLGAAGNLLAEAISRYYGS